MAEKEHRGLVRKTENSNRTSTALAGLKFMPSSSSLARRGSLQKVLAVIEGVGYSRVPTKDDKDEFEKEKNRWTDQLGAKRSWGAHLKHGFSPRATAWLQNQRGHDSIPGIDAQQK